MVRERERERERERLSRGKVLNLEREGEECEIVRNYIKRREVMV